MRGGRGEWEWGEEGGREHLWRRQGMFGATGVGS